MTQELLKAMDGEIFAVWFLIGAALVTLALGLLFLWLTVWTIGGGMGGVIRTIGNLHRKLCMKKGVSEE